jgi:hypothetical protein
MLNEDLRNIQLFYQLLDELEQKNGGKCRLKDCDGFMSWPERGVYFFFEPGEVRTTSGEGLRCVRVGTHALKKNSNTTLWKRLLQHRGTTAGRNPGGGNHRGSVFRHHVGTALMKREDWPKEIERNWGGSNAARSIKKTEVPYERAISKYIGSMLFIWLEIEDEPGPKSLRGYIERNTIALLSNYQRTHNPIDPPSPNWIGLWAQNEKIRKSGLWNVNHVDENYDEQILDTLKSFI